MLILNAAPYRGRFLEQAKELKKAGKRVGVMWVSHGDRGTCHACGNVFPVPSTESEHNDAWGECPKCKLPFIFRGIEEK